ncbi:hypothetical protein RZS08_19170, partial [Arthrospira platensis SPKY1]|nr:hypothetical protein [Arthrospira platensis SPKY1]
MSDFDTEKRVVKIIPKGQSRAISLKFNQVKRLRVMYCASTDVLFPPSNLSGAESAPSPFAVFLRDGSVYSGIAHHHQKVDQGLWVFPKGAEADDPFRVFIPKNGIVRFEVRSGDEGLISDTDFAQTML